MIIYLAGIGTLPEKDFPELLKREKESGLLISYFDIKNRTRDRLDKIVGLTEEDLENDE